MDANKALRGIDDMCPHCRPLASTTTEQLSHRMNQAAKYPDVMPYECMQCGSSAWMLTSAMLTDADGFDRVGPPQGLDSLILYAGTSVAVGLMAVVLYLWFR